MERVAQQTEHDCTLACLQILASEFEQLGDWDNIVSLFPFRVGARISQNSNIPYAPALDEIQAVLHRLGIKAGMYRTRTYYRDLLQSNSVAAKEWGLERRRYMTSEELYEVCKGDIALLCVKSKVIQNSYHLVVWDRERILDPAPEVPLPANWEDYEISELLLLNSELDNVHRSG